MPDLFHSLQGRDLGYLRIVAGLWGIDLTAPDVHSALPVLVKAMLDEKLLNEVIEALPVEAQTALSILHAENGRMPWAQFSRQFGSVREMGPGRRDRERPYLSPISATEMLWYRGLIARAFLKSAAEPQEFAYIPEEFLGGVPSSAAQQASPPGRPASPAEFAQLRPANDRILDHACTLLAALRANDGDRAAREGQEAILPAGIKESWNIPAETLQALLFNAGLIDIDGNPLPEPARAFLASSRGQALALLAQRWLSSPSFNELWMMPGMTCEGEWLNDALKSRGAILDLLSEVPLQAWWNITAFVASVRERQPDFQRPAGDYDSWFIRSESSGEFLRGIEHWDEVDGALVRYLITGPLHWLGILDLAGSTASSEPAAFRFSEWAEALLQEYTPAPVLAVEDAPVQTLPDGRLRLTRLTPRAVRYQVARFCEWEYEAPQGEYRYRITPASLEKASKQGLRLSHLLTLLRKHAASPLSPSLVQALERWENNGTQAFLENVCVLKVSTPEIMNALRRSPAARFLGDPLGPTTIIVKPAALEKVRAALVELGYLAEDKA